MKKTLFLSLCLLLGSIAPCLAQRIVLIDMEYITEKIPAYTQANEQLEELSEQFQQEINAANKEAENLYKEYQKNASTLSANARTEKEEAILAKEKEAAQLRQKYFGPNGELSQKQQELLQPINDQIYEVVKKISAEKGYDIVVDRASNQSIIFAQPRIDISNQVLSALGY